MDVNYTTTMIEMGASLTSLALKGTVSAINSKIRAIREEKNVEKVRVIYDEIINELISEREEAVRIAQAYKSELDKIEISDENIQHLNNTVGRVFEILKVMTPDFPLETYKQIKELINIDTLKAIQLLGFNYKAAIGEPLTKLCAAAILSNVKGNNSKNQSKLKR